MGNYFDQFDPKGPDDQAVASAGASNPFDKFDVPTNSEPDPGYLGEIKRGLIHAAIVSGPKMVGDALQFFGANEAGESISKAAQARETAANQESQAGQAHDSPWSIRGNVYEAAESGLQSFAPGAAGATVGAGIGAFAGPGGIAAGALIGYGIGSLAALPIFYGSQAKQSYDEVLKHQLESGASPSEAEAIARQTGHAEGAIEAGGEMLADVIPFVKIFKPLAKPSAKAAGELVKDTFFPGLKTAAKTAAGVVLAETGTEVAQQLGEDYARKAIGDTGEGATWDSASRVIVPTAMMSLIPGMAGAGARHHQAGAARAALEDPATDPDARAKIAMGAVEAMRDVSPEMSRAFAWYAGDQIATGKPIELTDDQFYVNYAQQAAKPRDFADEAAARVAAVERTETVDQAIAAAQQQVESVPVAGAVKSDIDRNLLLRTAYERLEKQRQEEEAFADAERQRLAGMVEASDGGGIIGAKMREALGMEPGEVRLEPKVKLPDTAEQAQAMTDHALQLARDLSRSPERRQLIDEEIQRRVTEVPRETLPEVAQNPAIVAENAPIVASPAPIVSPEPIVNPTPAVTVDNAQPTAIPPAVTPAPVAPIIMGKPVGDLTDKQLAGFAKAGNADIKAKASDEIARRAKLPATTAGQMYVEHGGRRYPVSSFADASRKWEQFRMATINQGSGGVSEIGNGIRITNEAGKEVARVSYNGRIWPPGEYKSGMKSLYDPYGDGELSHPENTRELPSPAVNDGTKAIASKPVAKQEVDQKSTPAQELVHTEPKPAETKAVPKSDTGLGKVGTGGSPVVKIVFGKEVTRFTLPQLRKMAKKGNARVMAVAGEEIARRKRVVDESRQARSEQIRSYLFDDIRAIGGISSKLMGDLTGESNAVGKQGMRGANIFSRRNALLANASTEDMSDIATNLAARGYAIDTSDVDGGAQQVRDMVREEMDNPGTHVPGQDQDAQFERMRQSRERGQESAELTEPEHDQADIDAQAVAESAALNDGGTWGKLTEEEKDAELDQIFAVPAAATGAQSAVESAPGGARAGAGQAGSEVSSPTVELTSQSEADLAAKAAREQDQATSDRARIKRESEAGAGAFQLQPQTKPESVANSEGAARIGDLFANIEPSKQSELAPTAEPINGVFMTVDEQETIAERIRTGDITPDEMRAEFERLIKSKAAITVQLAKLTKKELVKQIGSVSARESDSKESLVKSAYRGMLADYSTSQGISYNPMEKDGFLNAVRTQVENVTPEQIKAYADRIAEQRADFNTRKETWKKALTDPQTLEDFKIFIKYRGEAKMTPEQREKYDGLVADSNIENRQKSIAQNARVTAAGEKVGAQIVETKHTQKGHDLFVVQLEKRVEREDYNRLNTAAKKLGGYFSSYNKAGAVPGFQFKTRETAQAFQALVTEGDTVAVQEAAVERKAERTEQKVNAAAQRLTEMADSMEGKANKSLNADRLTNTARRARMASGAEAESRKSIALARTMRNLAAALDAGEAKHLEGIRHRTQVEALDAVLRSAWRDYLQAKSDSEQWPNSKLEAMRDEKPTADAIALAKMRAYRIPAEDVIHNIQEIRALHGFKQFSENLRAMAQGAPTDNNGNRWVTFTESQAGKYIEAMDKMKRDREAWQLRDAREQHMQFGRMGIPDDQTLRTALREFLQFKDAVPVADKVKELERGLAGMGSGIGIDYFPTPQLVAEQLARQLDVRAGMKVLEPSAGNGNLADAVKAQHPDVDIDTVEQSSTLRKILDAKGYNLAGSDFMDYNPGPVYDRILMNPPFSNGMDADHVRHAYDLLKPGGRLISITGEGIFFRADAKASEFRDWLDSVNGTSEKLPEGTFTDRRQVRTTGVASRVVTIDKPDIDIPAYSRAGGNPLSAAILQHLARSEEYFRYKTSRAKSLADIVNDVVPEKSEKLTVRDITQNSREAGVMEQQPKLSKVFAIRDNNGNMAEVFQTSDGIMWLNIQGWDKGNQGNLIYHIVANYAHNNGLIFDGDPFGISEDAMHRRTENMLNSALRFGTTRHLRPHERQIAGDAETKIAPLPWEDGNDEKNLQHLLRTAYDNVREQVPEIESVRYDFETHEFRGADDRAFTDADFSALAGSAGARSARAGRTTLKRAILIGSLLRAESSPDGRRGLLGEHARQRGETLADSLQGIGYRRGEQSQLTAGLTISEVHDQIGAALDQLDAGYSIHANVAEAQAALSDPNAPTLQADAKAFFYKGRLHFIAGNLESAEDAEEALWHEAFHAGFTRIYGNRGQAYEQALTTIAGRNQNIRTEAQKWRKAYGNDAYKAAIEAGRTEEQARRYVTFMGYEEALATLSQRNVKISGLNKFLAAAQKFMRAVGLNRLADWIEAHTDAEALATVLSARQALTTQQDEQGGVELGPVYQRADQIEKEAQLLIFEHNEWKTVADAHDWLIDDRSHGDEVLADGAREVWAERGGRSYGKSRDVLSYVMAAMINGETPAFSRTNQTETRAFKQWFDDSKVVDAEGSPLVVYHGTGNDFAEFSMAGREYLNGLRTAGASWFTPDAHRASWSAEALPKMRGESSSAPSVYPVYLSLQNPLILKPSQLTGSAFHSIGTSYPNLADRLKIVESGFDGVVISETGHVGDASEILAFKPEQIKSAIGNRGTFDADNPDIRYSRGTAALSHPAFESASNEFEDLVRSDRTLNRVISKFNTPFHLAEQHPEFKPLYNEAQDYTADVSRYANESADFAKTLLPRIESYADFPKESPSDADLSAVERAVHTGTLWGGANPLEGRLWTPAELKSGKADDVGLPTGFTPLTDKQVGLYQQHMAAIANSQREFSKSLIWKLARQAGLTMNRNMSLDDMAETARTAADEQIADLNAKLEVLSDQTRIDAHVEDMSKPDAEKYRRSQITEAARVAGQIDQFESFKDGINDIEGKTEDLIKHGYSPLQRFGRYAVNVAEVDERGNKTELFFRRYDTQQEANRAKRDLTREYAGRDEVQITSSVMPEEKHKLFQGINLDALEMFGKYMTDENGNAVLDNPVAQEFLRVATTERSALKRQLHRKGIPGFSTDIARGLAQFTVSTAHAIARNYHSAPMLELANEIKSGDLADYAARYVKYLQDPAEEAQALRGFLANYYILGSIAFGAVNMTQPVLMTAPQLSVYTSYANAMKQLGRAAKDMVTGRKTLTVEEKDAYARGVKEGKVSPQEIHQLRADTQANMVGQSRTWQRLQSVAAAHGIKLPGRIFMRKAAFIWGSIYSMTEQFNRGTTFLAAYRIAKENKERNPYGFAVKMIDSTQGVYNRANRPEASRGPIGGPLMTFKQFNIMYVELAKRLYQQDKKAFAVLMLTLMALAGAEGLPFAEDIEDLIDTIGQWLGYATNSKKKLRRVATDLLGKDIANMLLHGVSAIPGMPVDVAQRMGMQNLIPGTALLKTSEGDKTRDINELLGPAATLAKNVGAAAEGVATGQLGELKLLLPVALQNALKGAEMWDKGIYTDTRGRKLMSVDGVDATFKFLGFQPGAVAAETRIVGQNYQDINLQKIMEASIANNWAHGLADKDPDLVRRSREQLLEWNRNNPELRINLNNGQIIRRIREMRASREERFIKSAPPEIRGNIRRDIRE